MLTFFTDWKLSQISIYSPTIGLIWMDFPYKCHWISLWIQLFTPHKSPQQAPPLLHLWQWAVPLLQLQQQMLQLPSQPLCPLSLNQHQYKLSLWGERKKQTNSCITHVTHFTQYGWWRGSFSGRTVRGGFRSRCEGRCPWGLGETHKDWSIFRYRKVELQNTCNTLTTSSCGVTQQMFLRKVRK